MKVVEPEVYLITRPFMDWNALTAYLESEGYDAQQFISNMNPKGTVAVSGHALAEVMGRLCYRSFPGTDNENITKMRTDSSSYIKNILNSGHESVLEHVNYSFIIANVSRVESHEHLRHRVGTAISQESGRYVRNSELKVVLPECDFEINSYLEEEFKDIERGYLGIMEQAGIRWEGMPFSEKKELTSLLRRMLPNGQATTFGWTANIRTLRHTIALRTAPGAETEIRSVFNKIYDIMKEEVPFFFQDFEESMENRQVYARKAVNGSSE